MTTTYIPALGQVLPEQSRWLDRRIARARRLRDYAALPALTVAADISADAARACSALSATAYTAEQADLEALRLLETAAREAFRERDPVAYVRLLREARD